TFPAETPPLLVCTFTCTALSGCSFTFTDPLEVCTSAGSVKTPSSDTDPLDVDACRRCPNPVPRSRPLVVDACTAPSRLLKVKPREAPSTCTGPLPATTSSTPLYGLDTTCSVIRTKIAESTELDRPANGFEPDWSFSARVKPLPVGLSCTVGPWPATLKCRVA